MKIDLHCHTKKTKNKESDLRNVSVKKFKEKVELSEVKFLAITNHNCFFKDNYKELKEAVKDLCYVIPGIELDVEGINKSKGHVILIANPDDVDDFEKRVNQITKDFTPNNFIIGSHELYEKFKDMDIIYIAHFLKDKQLSIEDLEDFENIMSKPLRLLKEASNIVSIGVLQSNNHRAMIGTDVIDWNNYENCTFGNLKFEIKDYKSLLKLVDKDTQLITDLINENFDEKIIVYGKSETKEYPFELPIYDDVNIIFGDKGSGKTEILNSLKEHYEMNGDKYVEFSGGDKEEWYKKLISVNKEDYNIDNLQLDDNCANKLKNIINFSDETPTSIKTYYKYFKNASKNKKKTMMKSLLISKSHSFNDKIYKNLFSDYILISDFIKKLENFEYKNYDNDEINKNINSLNILKDNVYKKYKDVWLEENSSKLLDDFIEKMNNYVSQNIGSPSMPTETGLFNFVKKRVELKNNIKSITNILNKTSDSTNEYIGKLGLKGNVYLTTKYKFINLLNKKDINHTTLISNKGELANIITNMGKIMEDISSPKLVEYTKTIAQDCDNKDIKDLNDFMSIERFFEISGKQYKPSKGELAILSLQHDLISKKEYEIFLIDEPEANLGSTYINDEIVPLLKDLAHAKKKIVIATHDANIAIRTRPSNSILKIVDNENYKTYIGNMFTDILYSIDSSEKLSWKDESIKYLEGGKDAFEERGDLYE